MSDVLNLVKINELPEIVQVGDSSKLLVLDDLEAKIITKKNFLQEVLTGLVDLSNYVTQQQLDESLAQKADVVHIHAQYVTLTGLDSALASKANLIHTHSEYATITSVDEKLTTKSDSTHTHRIKDLDWTNAVVDGGDFV